ncbi:MAG TPA: hypothetical protein GX711_06145, partial [Clostridia bacterium]|nr:hypothetical protein [Clostridia bacterium]
IWTGNNLARSSFAHTGNFAVELGREPNLQSRISQTIDNPPTGKRYRLCFQARENIPANQANQAGYVLTSTLIFLDGQDRELDGTNLRMISGEIPRHRYQRFCLTTAPAPPATRRILTRITFAPLTSNKAMVKIDDMTVNAF